MREDPQLAAYAQPLTAAWSGDSQADNALESERCISTGRTPLLNTPIRCQGVDGHAGRHFNGPRIARTWWS